MYSEITPGCLRYFKRSLINLVHLQKIEIFPEASEASEAYEGSEGSEAYEDSEAYEGSEDSEASEYSPWPHK